MSVAVGLASTALSQAPDGIVHYVPSVDIAVVQGPMLTLDGVRSLERLAEFAVKNGFALDRGSTTGSPDYHIGVSPVIMANSHADGTLTIALVKDGNDLTDYQQLGSRFRELFVSFGFEELHREPVRVQSAD